MKQIPFFDERDYSTIWVKYHSPEWERYVESGFTTAYIGAGPRGKDALMIKPKTRAAGRKNPARKRRAKSRRSERGFFPKMSEGLRAAFVRRDVRAKVKAKRRRNPAINSARRNPLVRQKHALSVPERHALKIARDTLKMPPQMAAVMGGPTPAEAREIIKRLTGSTRRNPATHIRAGERPSPSVSHRKLRGIGRSNLRDPRGSRHDPRYAVQVKRGKAWITLGAFYHKANATDYGRALKTKYPSKSFRVFW